MPNYKALQDFELDGVNHLAGEEVELDETVAADYIKNGSLELVASADI